MAHGAVPRRILLVIDDDPAWRSLYRLEFGARFDIIEATDGREGLEQLERTGPDLVILDLSMPGMDGVRFLASLEGRRQYPPVIVCTARELEARRLARSVVRIVSKSPNLTALWEAVESLTPRYA